MIDNVRRDHEVVGQVAGLKGADMVRVLRPLLFTIPIVMVGAYWLLAPYRHDYLEFRNSSKIAIWVENAQGFDVPIRCGALSPGTSGGLSGANALVPDKTTIKWRRSDDPDVEKSYRTFEIDLSQVKRGNARDDLVFEFLPNETWTARYEAR